ncbi:CAP domain-containing protein [bacterium]|nr:CAP domain-containing protein [bacterium]
MSFASARKVRYLLIACACLGTIIIVSACGNAKKIPTAFSDSNIQRPSAGVERMLDFINNTRQNKGLAALILDDRLCSMAQSWTDIMARDCFCAHVHPEDKTLTTSKRLVLFNRQLKNNGLPLLKLDYISENVGYSADDTLSEKEHLEVCSRGFMNSRIHRGNILSKDATLVGIGLAYGKRKGIKTCYVTQIFGRITQSNTTYIGSDAL